MVCVGVTSSEVCSIAGSGPRGTCPHKSVGLAVDAGQAR